MARLYHCLTGRRPRLPPCPHPATPAPVRGLAAPMGLLCRTGTRPLPLHQFGASFVASVQNSFIAPGRAEPCSAALRPCIKTLAAAETILGRQPSMARLYHCLTGRRPRLPPRPHPATPAPVRGLFRCTNAGPPSLHRCGPLSLHRCGAIFFPPGRAEPCSAALRSVHQKPRRCRDLPGPSAEHGSALPSHHGQGTAPSALSASTDTRTGTWPLSLHQWGYFVAPVRGLFRCTNAGPPSLHQCGASFVARVEPSHARLLSGPCIKNPAGAETILGRQPSMARLYRCITGRGLRLPPCPHPPTPAPG